MLCGWKKCPSVLGECAAYISLSMCEHCKRKEIVRLKF
jgi:hypothetical protein